MRPRIFETLACQLQTQREILGSSLHGCSIASGVLPGNARVIEILAAMICCRLTRENVANPSALRGSPVGILGGQ